MPRSYPRVLTVQDISCVGQCSLTVALPLLSAAGAETCILPSAVLSTHTGGFTGFTFRDLTEDLPRIAAHWQKEGIEFDAAYTGYLGSAEQIAIVRDLFRTALVPGAARIVDPAMADNGKLYPGFDGAFVREMAKLASDADYLLPNLTEAALLTGSEYRETYDEAYVEQIAEKLLALGAGTVILTGIGFRPEKTGVLIRGKAGDSYYEHGRLPQNCHGTGDVYASVFVGALVSGKSAEESARIAADFTVQCIRTTIADRDHWYGVEFERCIPDLIRMLGK